MKDYYRYFYQDKIPLLQTSLKKYDKSPIANRMQCELYLNTLNSGVEQQAQQGPQNMNQVDFQQRSRNLERVHSKFVKGQYGDTSPFQSQNQNQNQTSGFLNRTYVVNGSTSGGFVQTSTPPFKDEEPLCSYSIENISSIEHNDDGLGSSDEPMDLTMDLTYNNKLEQMRIFEGISPESDYYRDEKVLDLSMKSSQRTSSYKNIPESYNNHNLYNNNNVRGSSAVLVQSNLLNERISIREQTYHHDQYQMSDRRNRVPPQQLVKEVRTNSNIQQHRPQNGSTVSANKNSVSIFMSKYHTQTSCDK